MTMKGKKTGHISEFVDSRALRACIVGISKKLKFVSKRPMKIW